MAQLEPTSYRPTVEETGDWLTDIRAEFAAEAREHDEALTRYEETGDIKGIFYRAPYADSYAVYRVTKLRPFTVQHVATGDGWNLPAPHIRGLSRSDVENYAERESKLRHFFANR